jgi:NAD-dependent protein deacetylase/lipoamidase
MDTEPDRSRIDAVASALASAARVAVLTGAGISAESGVPTFRGAGGVWEGQRAEDLATPQAFARAPEHVWAFYLWRRRLLAEKKPNAGHFALADIEKNVREFTLITQNVDGLHQSGGSRSVIELHGNIWTDLCAECRHSSTTGPNNFRDEVPYCDECGGMMRPGVVWFGEMLPEAALRAAQRAAAECDVMLVVGTSAVVQPAASLANWAKSNGATLIEVNPDATPLSQVCDVVFPCPAGSVLPQIAESIGSTA